MKDEPQERTRWLAALKNLGTATPGEAEQMGPDTTSSSEDEVSESLIQRGAKSLLDTLLHFCHCLILGI